MKNNKRVFVLIAVLILALVIIFAVRGVVTGNSITGLGIFDVFKGSSQEGSSDSGGKSLSAMGWSNGYPSGPHEKLIIHGHKNDFFESGGSCAPTKKGKVINVPEYGQAEIQIIQNRESRVRKLVVIDPCTTSTQDPAKIQLPYGKYQVYARALGKPTHKTDPEDRKIILYPKLLDVCNDQATSPIPGFGDFIDCSSESLYGLGIVSATTAFDMEGTEFTRISPLRGKNQAQAITEMFQWTGYACDVSVDNGDGQMTVADVTTDLDGDGKIDQDDLILYLELNCAHFDNEWVFNIADLVTFGWDAYNEGVKNFKVRFYPITSTEFCGDRTCGGEETCSNCPQDCGECPTVCGDGACNGEETCEDCPQDCGVCPPVCGDEVCDEGETCENCVDDCGECPPVCGDTVCDDTETCSSCEEDCGTCPVFCGDGTCDLTETCEDCPDDCGACPIVCGDGTCDSTETCEDCPDDCDICPPVCGDGICEYGELCAEDCA